MMVDILAILFFVTVSWAIGHFFVLWCMKSKSRWPMIVCCYLAGSAVLVASVNALAAVFRGMRFLLKYV